MPDVHEAMALAGLVHSPDVHLLVSAEDGVIQQVAGAAVRILRISPEGLRGTSVQQLIAEPTSPFSDELSAHDAVLVLPVKRGDGAVVSMDVTLCALETAHGAFLFISLRSTEERAQAHEHAWSRIHSVAERDRMRSVGQLAAGIAHDFNNLLTAILGHASLAKEAVTRESSTHGSLVQIEYASERAARLCSQLLAFAGEGVGQMAPLDLNQVVDQAYTIWHRRVPAQVRLHTSLSPLPKMIKADSQWIRELLSNLLVNAVEAISAAGEIRLRVFSALLPVKGEIYWPGPKDLSVTPRICLEVCDDGCGISHEAQARIFEPFYSTKFLGRGLGLAAVWGICRRHGACIVVNSTPARGTCIRIYFPGPQEDTAKLLPRALLLVDPEMTSRNQTASLLESLGVAVLPVKSLRQALKTWRECGQEVGACMIDLAGLKRDPEVLDQWITAGPKVPIFGLHGSEAEVGLLTSLGPLQLLPKPLTLQRLRAALHTHAHGLVPKDKPTTDNYGS